MLNVSKQIDFIQNIISYGTSTMLEYKPQPEMTLGVTKSSLQGSIPFINIQQTLLINNSGLHIEFLLSTVSSVTEWTNPDCLSKYTSQDCISSY